MIKKVFIAATAVAIASVAMACEETCPDKWPWVKIDNLTGKSYTYDTPAGFKVVEVCYKAGGVNAQDGGGVEKYYVLTGCEADITVTSKFKHDLSHASFRLKDCIPPTPPPTPSPTPTPPPTPTPTPTPCEPITECGSRCGIISDGCGGTIECGICPPPPPPPGRTPVPVCTICDWSQFISAVSANNYFEYFNFGAEGIIRQITLDAYENGEYFVYVGVFPSVVGAIKIPVRVGPGFAAIQFPGAGIPVRQWSDVWFTGGRGKLTIYVDNKNFIWTKGLAVEIKE